MKEFCHGGQFDDWWQTEYFKYPPECKQFENNHNDLINCANENPLKEKWDYGCLEFGHFYFKTVLAWFIILFSMIFAFIILRDIFMKHKFMRYKNSKGN